MLAAFLILAQPIANYAGYCSETREFLSEVDRNRAAYDYLLRTNRQTAIGQGDEILEVIDNGFHYKTFEEFVRENPHCCRYSMIGPLNIQIPFYSRITGRQHSFVRVEYTPVASDGTLGRAKEKKIRHLEISNCGTIRRITR